MDKLNSRVPGIPGARVVGPSDKVVDRAILLGNVARFHDVRDLTVTRVSGDTIVVGGRGKLTSANSGGVGVHTREISEVVIGGGIVREGFRPWLEVAVGKSGVPKGEEGGGS